MGYVVSVDLVDYGGPTVHGDWCSYWRNRKPDATTMAWHGPMRSYADAVDMARRQVQATPAQFDPPCCSPLSRARASGEDDPFERVDVRIREGGIWIGAVPASSQELGGTRWRGSLMHAAAVLPPPRAFSGVALGFTDRDLPADPAQHLVEQVDSALDVLVDKQRWLGNSRSGLRWWSAQLGVGDEVGTLIAPGTSPPGLPAWASDMVLDVTSEGEGWLPEPAARQLEAALGGLTLAKDARLAIHLQWGSRNLSVGTLQAARDMASWLRLVAPKEDRERSSLPIHWCALERGVAGLPPKGARVRAWRD